MHHRIWATALAAALLLMMTACTDSTDPIAQPTPSASRSEQPEGETPGTDATPTASDEPDGGDEFTADEAQDILDDTVATLRATDALQIRSRSRTDTGLGGLVWSASANWNTSTKWDTRQGAWASKSHYVIKAGAQNDIDGYTKEIFVDGRRFVNWSAGTQRVDSEWLDITEASRQMLNARTDQLSELEAMTATSARTVGKWTTVIGTVPNEVALTAFGLADSSQSMGVSERMNEEETRVFVQLSARAPVALSMRGVDTSTPGAELPPTFLNDLRASFYEARYEPTTLNKRITVPTPHEMTDSEGNPLPQQNG